MSDGKSSSSGGISFTGLLAIVFITLKLLHKLDWSWWWVLAPLWGGAALGVVIILFVLAGALVATAVSDRSPRRSLGRYHRSLTRGRK
jgi:hypothetical protein